MLLNATEGQGKQKADLLYSPWGSFVANLVAIHQIFSNIWPGKNAQPATECY